ncbi:MAG: hypothetical protein ACRD1X_20410 [Vicinamibacteria bacterium]
MDTEDSKEGEVASQNVHAYLMCDEADLPPEQRDGPRIRRAKILALWDGLGAPHVRLLAAVSRLSRGIAMYRQRDIETLRGWKGLGDPTLRALISGDVDILRELAGLPVWVACFSAPRTLERAPVVWIKRETGFLDLGSQPVSDLLYAGRIGRGIAPSLLAGLRSFDLLASG